MNASVLRPAYEAAAASMTRHGAIASILENAIREGSIAVGGRLPTVRALSAGLGVSASTVAAAYNKLRADGRISGEVGRGHVRLAAGQRRGAAARRSMATRRPGNRRSTRRDRPGDGARC